MAQLNSSATIGDMPTVDEASDLDGIGTCAIAEDVAMLEVTTPLSVSEVADRIGLSADTLRWYERIGLLERVGRDASGHRRYTAGDVEWLLLLIRLRTTGMSVRDMKRYAELVRAGEHTEPERLALLEAHREAVAAHVDELQRHLAVLDMKVAGYRRNRQKAEP